MRKVLAGLVSMGLLVSAPVFAEEIPKDQKEIEKQIRELADKYGCSTCHDIDKPKNSIPFRVIAKEYQGKPDAVKTLVTSIKGASFAKWQKIGPEKYGMKPKAIYMPRQRSIPEEEAEKIVKLILSLDTSKVQVKK
ncbi:MAG: flagellar biosynthesis protein FlgI [Aquificae bacterium]|nr:flagellar biosynthesis protein FlgI [Aquificota bacterium]